MNTKPEIRELNAAIEEFDLRTFGQFDTVTDLPTILLWAAAYSPRGTDLPARLTRAFRDVEKASETPTF